jgi:hypothetical protein
LTREVLVWANEPPRKRFVSVVSIKVGERLTFAPAGPLLGVYYHFLDGHSVPCSVLWGQECLIRQSQPCRWKAFIAAWTMQRAKRIVELTPAAVRSWPQLKLPSVAGTWWEATRRGPHRNSPLLLKPLDWQEPLPNVEGYDPIPSILDMWRRHIPVEVLRDHQIIGD